MRYRTLADEWGKLNKYKHEILLHNEIRVLP